MGLLQILITPAVLWIILFAVAGSGSDRSYSRLFFVSLAPALAEPALNWLVKPWDLVLTPAISAVILRRYCYLTWPRALATAVLLFAWLILSPVLLSKILSS